MSRSSTPATGGVGFCGLLAVAFIVLKLCGVIGWSWWWVTSPIWIPFLIIVAIFLIVIACVLISNGKE